LGKARSEIFFENGLDNKITKLHVGQISGQPAAGGVLRF
jgi:hypothetical protein